MLTVLMAIDEEGKGEKSGIDIVSTGMIVSTVFNFALIFYYYVTNKQVSKLLGEQESFFEIERTMYDQTTKQNKTVKSYVTCKRKDAPKSGTVNGVTTTVKEADVAVTFTMKVPKPNDPKTIEDVDVKEPKIKMTDIPERMAELKAQKKATEIKEEVDFSAYVACVDHEITIQKDPKNKIPPEMIKEKVNADNVVFLTAIFKVMYPSPIDVKVEKKVAQ